jgi:hypothetical protein
VSSLQKLIDSKLEEFDTWLFESGLNWLDEDHRYEVHNWLEVAEADCAPEEAGALLEIAGEDLSILQREVDQEELRGEVTPFRAIYLAVRDEIREALYEYHERWEGGELDWQEGDDDAEPTRVCEDCDDRSRAACRRCQHGAPDMFDTLEEARL